VVRVRVRVRVSVSGSGVGFSGLVRVKVLFTELVCVARLVLGSGVSVRVRV
jgi:hypothetical protein